MQSYPNFNPPSLWGTSTNRNRFQGIDISGSLDISGGPLTIQNNQFGIYENGQPRLRINPWIISVTNYDPTGNTYTSVDISMNKLILIKDISVNVSDSLSVINSKIQYIGTNGDYTNISSNVDISGNTNIGGNLTTNSYAIFSGTGDASFNIPIKATSATFNGLIQAKADASLNGNVNIGGLTTISGDLSLNRNINIQGNSTIYGDQTIKGNLFIDGSYTYINTNQLQVIDPIITINKNGLTTTNLGVEFNQVVNQVESTTGYIKSDSVTGSTFLIKAPGPSSTEGIIVQQNTSNNTVYIENIDISGTTRANGDISANQNVRIQYDLSVNRNTFVGGDLSVNQLTRIQDLSVNQNAFIRGDLSANGQFKGTTASLTSNLTSSNGVLQFSNSTGNSWIGIGTGNIGINQNNPSANLDVSGTVNITSNTIVGGDLSANGRLLVQGDASFNRNAFVAYTLTASGNIVALSDLSINQRLLVQGDASFNANVGVASTFTASGNIVALSDISANNRLFVQSDASFNANVGVASTFTASGNIVALSDISINQRLLVQGDASFNANVGVASTLTASGNIVALSDISANGRLLVQSDASFNSNVRVASTLTASGNIVALSDISANGNLYLQKDASLNGVVTINNTFSPTDIALDVSGGQNIRGNAYIQKLYLSSTPASTVPTSTDSSGLQIYWDKAANLNRIQAGQNSDRRLIIDASAVGIDITPSTNAVFEVLGNTLIRGSVGIITDGETLPDYTNFKLDISGNTITRGRATITDLSVNQNLYVQSDASFNANVRVASIFTASGNIVALSDISANNRLLVQSDASFNSNVRVASVFTASGNIVGLSDLSLNGRAFIQNDASFNANVRVASTFTASGNIVALSDISANRNIYVQGDASFNGNVRINGGFLSGEKIVQLYGGPIGTPTTIPIQSTTSTLNYGLNIDTRFDTSGGFSATGTTVTGIQRGPIISMDRSGAYQFYCTPDASGIYYRYDFSSNSNAGFTPFETTPNSNNRYSTMSCTANGNYLFVGFSNNGGTDSSTNIVRKFDVSTKPTTLPVDVSLQLYPYSSTDFIRNISSDNTGQKIVIGTTKGLYISTDGLISVNYVTLNDPSASQITNQPSGYYSTNIYNTKITPDGTKIFAILKKNTGDLSYNLCYGNFPSDGSLVNTKLTANPTSMYCPIYLTSAESSSPGAWAKMAMSDNGMYIYIGSKTGIYRSTDGGQTISFIELSGNVAQPINVVACDSTGKYVIAISTNDSGNTRYSAFSTNYGSTFNSFTVSSGTIRFTDILISDISAVSGFIYAIAGNRNPASGSVRTEIFNPQPAYNYFSFGNSTIDGQYLNLLSYDQNSKNILPSSTTLNYGESPVTQLTMSDTNNNVKMRWDNQAGKWYIHNNDRAQMTNSTVDVPFMIGGNTIIRGKATTTTDLSVNRNLYVQGDASFNANVRVATVFTASGNIVALSDISANGQLLVQGDASLNGKLLVQSDASFNSKISVQSDASINGVVKINNINNATFSLDVSGNTITRGKATTTDLSVNRYFYVQNDASFNGKIVQNLSGTNIQFGDSTTFGTFGIGNANVVIGKNSGTGTDMSSSSYNVIVGSGAGNSITGVGHNIIVGSNTNISTGTLNDGYNQLIGVDNNTKITKGSNFVAGYNSFIGSDGEGNVIIGRSALKGNSSATYTTTTNYNVAIGFNSFFNSAIISNNVGIGRNTGWNDISGNNNTYIGALSGPSTDNSGNKYTYLTCIGASSGSDASLNGSNRIILGSLTGSEDVILGGTGKIYTRSGINIDFSGNRIITGDISCNRNLYVQSDASLNGRLLVQSDASFNGKISVQSDASINGVVKINNINNSIFSLDILGNTITRGRATITDLSVNRNLYVQSDASLNGKLLVQSDASFNGKISVQSDASINGVVKINNINNATFSLDVNGSVNATSYNATSDYRIKTNIIPLEETHASVDTLRPVSYFNTLSAKQDYGFIAHEVAEYYPFLVNGQRDVSGEYQSLNYTGIIPILVKDLKQTKQELMETKQELMETKQELSDLRERFSSLETTFANFLSK